MLWGCFAVGYGIVEDFKKSRSKKSNTKKRQGLLIEATPPKRRKRKKNKIKKKNRNFPWGRCAMCPKDGPDGG